MNFMSEVTNINNLNPKPNSLHFVFSAYPGKRGWFAAQWYRQPETGKYEFISLLTNQVIPYVTDIMDYPADPKLPDAFSAGPGQSGNVQPQYSQP